MSLLELPEHVRAKLVSGDEAGGLVPDGRMFAIGDATHAIRCPLCDDRIRHVLACAGLIARMTANRTFRVCRPMGESVGLIVAAP